MGGLEKEKNIQTRHGEYKSGKERLEGKVGENERKNRITLNR